MSDKRNAILKASASTIAHSGIRGLRVNEVAADAGVSTALLYYYFTDRTGLLDASLKFMMDQSRSYRSALDAPEDSAWALLLNHVAQEFQDDPLVIETTMAWNELRSASVHDLKLRSSMSEAAAEWRGEISDSIRLAQDSGEIPLTVDSEQAAVIIVALMEGLGGQWISGELTVAEAHQVLARTVTALLRPALA